MEITIVLKKGTNTKNAYLLPEKADGKVFLPAVSDIMFRVMFNNSKRKKYVSYLLSLILNKDFNEILNSIEFEKDNLDKDNYFTKGETVDFICKIEGIYYGIEMNCNPNISALERNISYVGNIYRSSSLKSERYKYNTVIQLNFNNFNFNGEEREIIEYALRDEIGEILTDKIKIIYISIPKIREKYYNKSELNEFEKFLMVINEPREEDIKEFMKDNRIMEEYRMDADRTSRNENVVGLYNRAQDEERIHLNELDRLYNEGIEQGITQGIDIGRSEGIDIGRREGKAEGKIEIIKNMIQDKVEDSIIMKYVKISSKELERIKSEM